ncbi:MAG: thiamine pyrophosphate-binding protein [Burkholderiaceae bacterium]
MRGADLLVRTLANAGVEVIFTLSGNQIMPVFDACLDAGIKLIHTRHEGAAVFMAEGYAQLTGKLGVALVTAAPGFGNALGPLYMATQGESPVLLLSGDSPVSQDTRGAFQEFDQVAVASGLTKFSRRPMTSDALGTDAAEAIRVALSGRPGPVHLALAFDLLNGATSTDEVPSKDDLVPRADPISDKDLQMLTEALAVAERPAIITGPAMNATRAGDLIRGLADSVDAPVIPMESPRGLNDPSLGDFASALANADLVISLGKSIDFTTGFGQALGQADAPVLVIDASSKELERAKAALGSRLSAGINANPREMAAQLHERAQTLPGTHKPRTEWRQTMALAMARRQPESNVDGSSPMRPAVLCAAVQQMLDSAHNPILVIDGGEFGQWAQSLVSAPRRIINGPSGAIGGCLCYAIAAQIAEPDATVVVLMGDGTVGFHFAELETAHRYGAGIVAVIGHDAKWNAEYQIQLREYGKERLLECELNPTRYDLAAAGFGCHGEFVTDPKDLIAALTRAAASELPACVAVEIEGLPAPSGAGH